MGRNILEHSYVVFCRADVAVHPVVHTEVANVGVVGYVCDSGRGDIGRGNGGAVVQLVGYAFEFGQVRARPIVLLLQVCGHLRI